MNTVLLLTIILAGIVLLFCDTKEAFKHMPYYQEISELKPIKDIKIQGLRHFRQFSFMPYYTTNVKNIGQRGCHTDKYWDCVHKDKDMKPGEPISEATHERCVKYSNEQCEFPKLLSHSRTDPYYQYLHYA